MRTTTLIERLVSWRRLRLHLRLDLGDINLEKSEEINRPLCAAGEAEGTPFEDAPLKVEVSPAVEQLAVNEPRIDYRFAVDHYYGSSECLTIDGFHWFSSGEDGSTKAAHVSKRDAKGRRNRN